jgi:hypothetical protein
VNFSNLPNQGVNLRLYTYDPVGTAYYSPTGFIYNTGHYDINLQGGPCSSPDAQGFNDPASMNAYAASRGEMLVLVTRADLPGLCAATKPVTTVVAAPSPVVGPINTGYTFQGGVSGTTIVSGGGGGAGAVGAPSPSTPPGYIPPPGTSISAGGLPPGTSAGQTAGGITQLFRFILYDPSSNPNLPYATGANYPGCSQTNTANCDPQAFPTLNAAIDYAISRGEIPYKVSSPQEPWLLMNGQMAINPANILTPSSGMNPVLLIAAGLAAVFLLRK